MNRLSFPSRGSKGNYGGLLTPSVRSLLAVQRTIRRTWEAEPVALLVNLERRKGNERSAALINFVHKHASKFPSKAIPALAALLAEDTAQLEARLRSALNSKVRPRDAKFLADISLTAGHPELAFDFAKSIVHSSVGARLTKAKLLWYEGEMTKAIDTLSGDHPRELRLRESYKAEREVFGGWRPDLNSRSSFAARPNVVLHLLTNSLPHTESGYTQRTHSLLLQQASAGVEVHAVTRLGYPQSLDQGATQKIDIVDGIRYHRMLMDGNRGNLREHHQEEAERLLDLVNIIRPSVLHTTTHFVNGIVAREVAETAGIPWVYEVRGLLSDTWASKRGPNATKSERYLRFKRGELDVAKSADGIISIGKQVRNLLVERDVDPEKIRLAPNGVGEDYLKEPRDSQEVRQELGLDVEPKYFGTVSSLVGYEGLETLIEAYARMRNSRTDVRLLIVGDGDAHHALKRLAKERSLDPDEIFPGRVSRKRAVLFHQAMDVFVVPRMNKLVTRNVTPLKPVEAMAMGRPVVASDLPAIREIITHNETGILVPAGDVDKLQKAIEGLLDSPKLLKDMGARAREKVLSERTWSHSVRASLEWYEKFSASEDASLLRVGVDSDRA